MNHFYKVSEFTRYEEEVIGYFQENEFDVADALAIEVYRDKTDYYKDDNSVQVIEIKFGLQPAETIIRKYCG